MIDVEETVLRIEKHLRWNDIDRRGFSMEHRDEIYLLNIKRTFDESKTNFGKIHGYVCEVSRAENSNSYKLNIYLKDKKE